MSAILVGAPDQSSQAQGSIGPDGIRRYKTRCKVLIDSHNASDPNSTLELFDDVFAVETSKTLKGAGQATVTLTPSLNYLNLVFPNDYINIYFDIGDGSGWTRTFFGYVDRIEESYVVEKSGAPKTTYRLICTDFYKAFDRTMIYFNPHLAGRRDFVSYDFNAINIGGLALLTKGIVAGGAPPDVISNIVQLLIGFGTQFILPSSYQPGDIQELLRKARAELVYGQLSNESLDLLRSINGGYKKLREEANAEAAKTVSSYDTGSAVSEEDRLKALAKEYSGGISVEFLRGKSVSERIKLLADQKINEQLTLATDTRGKAGLVGSEEGQQSANIAILDSTISSQSSLSDIVDTFTFIERRSIDGYMFGQPVWQKQGSLVSILRSFSNESMNELFFDLRPLSASPGSNTALLSPVEGEYARSVDDKWGNISDLSTKNGITYIPAIVMREYPFSTIEGLDLRDVDLQLDGPEGGKTPIGLLYFGAIFNDKPNIPGRHAIVHPNINIADKALGEAQVQGIKHLDVAVISEEEVKSSSLGRSDNDHFNLFEFYSDNILGSDQRFYMRDILPIITPIQLLRNGIRVRSVTTRAARFSLESIKALRSADFDRAVAEANEGKQEEERKTAKPQDISLPIFPDKDVSRWYRNNDQANWGYRPKNQIGMYVFHQGIDIYKRPLHLIPEDKRNQDIPIRAIADGEIVVSAPEGCYNGYGNVVVIKHYFEGIGWRYSVYAHLDRIATGFGKGVLKGTDNNRPLYCAKGKTPGVRKGTKTGIPVSQDEVIGYMGNSGFSAAPGTKFHLHFEIDRHFPPRNDNVTNRVPIAGTSGTPDIPYEFDRSGTSTEEMKAANQNSCDPDFFYLEQGIDLQAEINSTSDAEDEPGVAYEPDDTDLGSNSPEETDNRPQEDVEEEEGKTFDETGTGPLANDYRDSVDTASSRKQIIRWALLQDHWYQHNLEYLSGRIDMRGAPEIRVGYRLDVKERNMSFYVEGVNHKWTFPSTMETNLAVSRGQANNPYPLYVYPNSEQMNTPEAQRRTSASRLAHYFVTPDPVAIRRSLFIRNGSTEYGGSFSHLGNTGAGLVNSIDNLYEVEFDNDTSIAYKYDELVSPAGSAEYSRAIDEQEYLTPESSEKSRLDPVSGRDARGAKDQ